MKIRRVEARAIRLPRDMAAVTGTAGTPTALEASDSGYRWSRVYPCLYSVHFESALVRVDTDTGIEGWGEAQAPLAPEVACAIVDRLLAPVLTGEEFDGSIGRIEQLWDRMYSTMRVRGQTGGFMIDAISAVDIALYDIAGKLAGLPVCRLLDTKPRPRVPAYLSGMQPGATDTRGFSQVKLFYDTDDAGDFFRRMDSIACGIAVDALWRLTPESAPAFGRELDARGALWLEAPLLPEDAPAHGVLARAIQTPVAIGESYRTRFELEPFLRENALRIFQPDIGRCGITEGLRMARRAAARGIRVVPHISIALGPQIAAALHFAAVAPGCDLAEYNPQVLAVANRHLREPLALADTSYVVPQAPGLGIAMRMP
jgi:galactonate dehydratase